MGPVGITRYVVMLAGAVSFAIPVYQSEIRKYKRTNARVMDEGEVMRKVLPTLCGDSDIPSR